MSPSTSVTALMCRNVLEDTMRSRLISHHLAVYRVVQKTDTQFYFWDNFGNSALILTILSLLQAEIYGA